MYERVTGSCVPSVGRKTTNNCTNQMWMPDLIADDKLKCNHITGNTDLPFFFKLPSSYLLSCLGINLRNPRFKFSRSLLVYACIHGSMIVCIGVQGCIMYSRFPFLGNLLIYACVHGSVCIYVYVGMYIYILICPKLQNTVS